MFSIKGLCVGYADFSEMPSFLRSPESPDFDLLVLYDGEKWPWVCERGLYIPYHWLGVNMPTQKPRIALTVPEDLNELLG